MHKASLRILATLILLSIAIIPLQAQRDSAVDLTPYLQAELNEIATLKAQSSQLQQQGDSMAAALVASYIPDHQMQADMLRNLMRDRRQNTALTAAPPMMLTSRQAILQHDLQAHAMVVNNYRQLMSQTTDSRIRQVAEMGLSGAQRHYLSLAAVSGAIASCPPTSMTPGAMGSRAMTPGTMGTTPGTTSGTMRSGAAGGPAMQGSAAGSTAPGTMAPRTGTGAAVSPGMGTGGAMGMGAMPTMTFNDSMMALTTLERTYVADLQAQASQLRDIGQRGVADSLHPLITAHQQQITSMTAMAGSAGTGSMRAGTTGSMGTGTGGAMGGSMGMGMTAMPSFSEMPPIVELPNREAIMAHLQVFATQMAATNGLLATIVPEGAQRNSIAQGYGNALQDLAMINNAMITAMRPIPIG